jgi:hypothetical protein
LRDIQNIYKLKISSLNVCGLKTRIQFPDFILLLNSYDILCVQETKLNSYDIIDVPGFTFYSKPRKDNYLRKSGGIAFFIKNTIVDKIEVLESLNEYVFWIKVKSSLLKNFDDDIIIGSVYIPPDQSRFFKEDEFFDFQNLVSDMCCSHKHVMLIGDFNGHTADKPDYIVLDDFIANQLDLDDTLFNQMNTPQLLSTLNVPLRRVSMDTKLNDVGNKILDLCKNNEMLIVNGRIGRDKAEGNFTFRNTSVIDYAL